MTIQEIFERGAVLYLYTPDPGPPMLMASPFKLEPGRLAYFDLLGDRDHVLEFEQAKPAHDLGWWFYRGGRKAAYLTLAEEESEEMAQAFRKLWGSASEEQKSWVQRFVEGISDVDSE